MKTLKVRRDAYWTWKADNGPSLTVEIEKGERGTDVYFNGELLGSVAHKASTAFIGARGEHAGSSAGWRARRAAYQRGDWFDTRNTREQAIVDLLETVHGKDVWA